MVRLLLLGLSILLTGCVFSSENAPHSTNVPVGTSEQWIISTECGLDEAVFDIDGSLWVPTNLAAADRQGPPDGFDPDNDVGVLTLTSEDQAVYRSSLGRSIPLVRLPGNFVIHEC